MSSLQEEMGLALEVANIESLELAYVFLGVALCFAIWALWSYKETRRKFSFDVYSQITSGGSTSGEDVIREITVKGSFHSDRKFKYLNVMLTELVAVDNSLNVADVLLMVMRDVRSNTIRDIPVFRFRPLVNELIIVTEKPVRKRQIKQVFLHAECSAVAFYKSCGFEESGAPFWEADIKQIKMQKQF